MLGISPLSPSLVEGLGLTRFQVAFIVPSIYLAGLLFSLPGSGGELGVRSREPWLLRVNGAWRSPISWLR